MEEPRGLTGFPLPHWLLRVYTIKSKRGKCGVDWQYRRCYTSLEEWCFNEAHR
jgi:hypothetical protein